MQVNRRHMLDSKDAQAEEDSKVLSVYEGPAKSFVTGFGLLQCYILSNIFLLQTFKVFPLY